MNLIGMNAVDLSVAFGQISIFSVLMLTLFKLTYDLI